MNKQNKLKELKNSFMNIGVIKGGELLLPVPAALEFIDELEKLEVVILGCDGWRYSDPVANPTWIVQDLEADYSVNEAILNRDDSAKQSANAVKDFILSLSERVDFISLTIEESN